MIDFASRKHNIKKNIEMNAHEGMSVFSCCLRQHVR